MSTLSEQSHDLINSQTRPVSPERPIPEADTNSSSNSSDTESDSPSYDGSSSEEEITISTTPASKPNVSADLTPNPALQSRLAGFFSRLAKNPAPEVVGQADIIEEDSSDSGFEDAEDGDADGDGNRYIEMNLALGVLEERSGLQSEILVPSVNHQGEEMSSSEDDDSEDKDDHEYRGNSYRGTKLNEVDRPVLESLMQSHRRRKLVPKTRRKPKVEVLD